MQGAVELGHGFLHQGHGLLEIVVDRLLDRRRLEPPRFVEEAIHQASLVAFGAAFAGVEVQADAPCLQLPGRLARAVARAARVGGVGGFAAAGVQELQPLGPATGPQRRKVETRREEPAFERLRT